MFFGALAEDGAAHADAGGMVADLGIKGKVLLLRNRRTCPYLAQRSQD